VKYVLFVSLPQRYLTITIFVTFNQNLISGFNRSGEDRSTSERTTRYTRWELFKRVIHPRRVEVCIFSASDFMGKYSASVIRYLLIRSQALKIHTSLFCRKHKHKKNRQQWFSTFYVC